MKYTSKGANYLDDDDGRNNNDDDEVNALEIFKSAVTANAGCN